MLKKTVAFGVLLVMGVVVTFLRRRLRLYWLRSGPAAGAVLLRPQLFYFQSDQIIAGQRALP